MNNQSEISQENFTCPAPGVWASPWRDNYDASRLVLLDLIRRHKVKGDYVAMVPNRDRCFSPAPRMKRGWPEWRTWRKML